MRKICKTHINGSISVPADLAEILAGRPVSPGEEVPVPIHLPTSSPQSNLPASCNVVARALGGGAFACHIKGLGPFLRSNWAEAGSSILLLLTVPPDPANGYHTPSLTVRLANRPEGADYNFVYQVMYDYAVNNGVWISTHVEYETYFGSEAKRREAIGKDRGAKVGS